MQNCTTSLIKTNRIESNLLLFNILQNNINLGIKFANLNDII